LLVNRRTNGLQKPPAYHLDLLVCGLFVYPVCSILGLPFPVAATVRSLTHLISLTNYEVQEIKGGGQRKVPTSVVEQRVTNFSIHILIGMAVFLAPCLKYLPKAVLYGVFLFMGVSSLNGNELFERLGLWAIWDTSKYPHYPYLQKVSVKRVHIFTGLQAVGLAVLYTLKSIKEVAVVFPFFIAFLAIVRLCFGRLFTSQELQALDGAEEEEGTEDAHKCSADAAKISDKGFVEDLDVEKCALDKIERKISGDSIIRTISGNSGNKSSQVVAVV